MIFYNTRRYIEDLFKCLLTLISPKLNTQYNYYRKFKRRLNLENPQTSNEKILWLKLNTYNGNKLVEQCADKCAVRKYVAECGCNDIIIPSYGIYDNANDIPWSKLPNKFVIKSNYGCGLNLICKDKEKLNIANITSSLAKWKKNKQHLIHSEMQYANMQRKYLCEQYLETEDGESPEDYKVYCCNGKAKYVMVCTGRSTDTHPKFLYLDSVGTLHRELSNDGINAPKDFTYPVPDGWQHMIECAEILSKPFPFVRSDFYIIKGKVYFGELTFTPCAGLDNEKLPITDKLIGDAITLLKDSNDEYHNNRNRECCMC